MHAAWLLRTLLASLVVVVVVCAAFQPSPVTATEEPADDAGDGTITTTLYPGWNMVGWVSPETPASELFDDLPALGRIFVWDGEEQRYRQLMPSSGSAGDQHLLAPGDGLWLYIGGTSPVEWTRKASETSVLLELRAGRNLVAWAGRDGTPIEEAVGRFGEALVSAWRWDAGAQEYRLFAPTAGLDQVQELNHGDALRVELSSGGRWWQSGAAPPPVVFLGEFTGDERAEVVDWVDGTRALFGERWGVEGPATTTYVGDREAVAPTYRRVRGTDDVITCGDYGGWVIFLVDGCVNGGAHAHEYFHALQGHLMAWSSKWVPGWMLEGSASYALILYRGSVSTTQTGDERIQEARHQDEVVLRRHKLLTLSELEEYSATVKPGNFGYTLGFLAVAWLAERAGEQSIIDFFVRLADEPAWRDAFEGAFGLLVDDFYEHFEAYLAEVAAPLPHVADDSAEPALLFVGDVPVDTRAAVREEFERIQAFFVEELGAGTADYTMLVAADEASAGTAHQLVFSTEYGGRCINVLYGVAGLVNLGCTKSPEYGLVFPHYEGVKNQLALSGSLPRAPDGRRTSGPAWLVRGAFTYVKYRYLDMAGHEDYGSLRAARVLHSRGTMLPLADMVAYIGFSGRDAAVGFLAAEWLLERVGDTALFEYYRLLDGSETWEEAFEAAFGIAVDDFYEAFEAYRARVAPPIEGADAS